MSGRDYYELKEKDETPSYKEWKDLKAAGKPEQIRVLSFNVAVEGRYGLAGVIELIRNSKADLIGLQEAGKSTEKIANALGYEYVQNGTSAILSKLKIDSQSPGKNGIVVQTESGQKIAFFNRHLYYKPYQPYQLLGIPYEGAPFIKTESEAISEAKKARGAEVTELLKDIDYLSEASLPTIVVGDFNEPSHLDWTEAAAKAGRHPIKVEWPTSKVFAEAGFKDAYREIHSDEMKYPGYTWTPISKHDDPKDHHDRIDFILYRGLGINLNSVDVIGENKENADIPFVPFPSDHRAVTAEFVFEPAVTS